MKKEYDAFVDNPESLPDGEVAIALRELTPADRKKKYLTRYVRALISRDPRKIPDGDILWLRWQRGRLNPEPRSIKILEELGEFFPKKAIFKT